MNRLPGNICAVTSEGGISLVDVAVGDEVLTAMLVETPQTAPYLRPGAPVSVLFKETEVSLAKELGGRLSLRNRLGAKVIEVRHGALLSSVELDCQGHRVASIITRRSAERLELAEGDAVEALIKANEVMLAENCDGL